MYNGFIVFAIVILVIIDVSVAIIINKAGLPFALGLIPVFQFILLGKVANKIMLGVIVACLTAITGVVSIYTIYLGINKLNSTTNSNEPVQTVMVEHQVTDAQGNVVSSSISYEPLEQSSPTNRLMDIMNSPEIKSIRRSTSFLDLIEMVFYVMLMYCVCVKFDKSILFLLGIIILPFIFLPIMALDDSSYSY